MAPKVEVSDDKIRVVEVQEKDDTRQHNTDVFLLENVESIQLESSKSESGYNEDGFISTIIVGMAVIGVGLLAGQEAAAFFFGVLILLFSTVFLFGSESSSAEMEIHLVSGESKSYSNLEVDQLKELNNEIASLDRKL